MFSTFTPTSAVPPSTIARYEATAPPELVALWRQQGAGLIGDGFLRVIDPDRALSMLNGVVSLAANAVPVFTTALADVVVYVEPAFHILRFRYGTIDFLAFDTRSLLADVQDEPFLDEMLGRRPYAAAVAELGVPGPDECFGYAPLLALGGPEDPSHLHRVGLWEHLALIAQYAGPASNGG